MTRLDTTRTRGVNMRCRWLRPASLVVAILAAQAAGAEAQGAGTLAQPTYQLRHWNGQGLAPVYEGWDKNDDGTYNMWFGYMNRNYEEDDRSPGRRRKSVRAGRCGPGPADLLRYPPPQGRLWGNGAGQLW